MSRRVLKRQRKTAPEEMTMITINHMQLHLPPLPTTAAEIVRHISTIPVGFRLHMLLVLIGNMDVNNEREIEVLANVVSGLPDVALLLQSDAPMELVRVFLRTGVHFSYSVYLKFYHWLYMRTIAGVSTFLPLEALSPDCRVVLKNVILCLFEARGFSLWYSGLLHIRVLRELFKEDAHLLHSFVPAAYSLRLCMNTVWRCVADDDDLVFFDTLCRNAWKTNTESPSRILSCAVCLSDKPAACFGMLSCESHMLCATCILEMQRHGHQHDQGYFVCPFRCSYNAIAIPLVVFESLMYERLVLSVLCTRPSPSKVDVAVNQYVGVRITQSGLLAWAKVDKVFGSTLVRVYGQTTMPVYIPARSDFIVGVSSEPPSVTYDNHYIVRVGQEVTDGVTFYRRNGQGTGRYYCRMGQTNTFLRTCEPSVYGQSIIPFVFGDVPKTLVDQFRTIKTTHVPFPSNILGTCPCDSRMRTLQRCCRCKQYSCALCYGCAMSICAICVAKDAISPHEITSSDIEDGDDVTVVITV